MKTVTGETVTGSMGSEFTILRIHPKVFDQFAQVDWNVLGRRVFVDPARNIISYMTPSLTHGAYSRAVDAVAVSFAKALGLVSAPLGDSRWRPPGADKNIGAEPDACFYIGSTAESYARSVLEGIAAAEAFAEKTPPDLVVDVEMTSGDDCKPGRYRELGVSEMWRVDVLGDGLFVEFLNLQAPQGPNEVVESDVLPGATREFIVRALDLARALRYQELGPVDQCF